MMIWIAWLTIVTNKGIMETMNKTLRTFLPLPLCLAFLAALCFGAPGSVLCIGDCGHMELETICLPPCCGSDVCEAKADHECDDDHDECSNCSDLDIDGPFWSKRYTRTAKPVPTSAGAVAALIVLPSGSTPVVTSSRLSHDHGPPLGAKAPTILRC